MAACIRGIQPDLIGTQEGLYPQLKDIAADLQEYSWIGLGRDGGIRGEFMAIFYRTARFEPMEYDHFWLSSTPNVVASSTWGHSNRRMVTWVRFKELQSGKEFFFINTHLDHEVQKAREKAAALIRERVLGLKTTLPVLLVGDFNAEAGGNPAYSTLVGKDLFTDTWTTAAQHRGELVNTFHGFAPARKEGVRIDWILTRGDVTADAIEIIQYSQAGQFPSDHFPVVAWLSWGR